MTAKADLTEYARKMCAVHSINYDGLDDEEKAYWQGEARACLLSEYARKIGTGERRAALKAFIESMDAGCTTEEAIEVALTAAREARKKELSE